jgi:hypothetical protein
MKVFHASYSWSGSWGAYAYHDCIVVEQTKSKALGRVLMSYPETQAKDWSLVEIDVTQEGMYHISTSEN